MWGWVLAGATVAVNIVLGGLDRRLQDAGAGIVEFELARTFARSAEILAGWATADVVATAKASILLDLPFIVLYVLSLGVAVRAIARRCSDRGFAAAARWGPLLGWAALAAGAFDLAENACLWMQLSDGARRIYSLPAFLFAVAKFALLLVVIVYLAVAGIASLRRRTT